MFGLFKSAEPKVKVIDKIWMTKESKMAACQRMLQTNQNCLFIAWFEETLSELKHVLSQQDSKSTVVLADSVDSNFLEGKIVMFVEHYPMTSKEQALFEKLNLREVPVLTALDEPFFKVFGGERIINAMKRMGMEEGEVVGHDMITSAIRRAQSKLEKKVISEKRTSSQKEWFDLNMR